MLFRLIVSLYYLKCEYRKKMYLIKELIIKHLQQVRIACGAGGGEEGGAGD